MLKKILSLCMFCALALTAAHAAQVHPSLLLTREGVKEIRAAMGGNPAFDASLAQTRADADQALASPIEVPTPKDGGGGYSHEKHKDNYYAMFNSGIMWQLTGEVKYAAFVRDMLGAYAEIYPTLGLHPVKLSKTTGRLFWQTLNECVWLVHTSVAYDCVYDFLSPAEHKNIEDRLLRNMAHFLMDGNTDNNRTFNLMHNHGTWAAAAVGMAGYAMDDKELVAKALYGSDKSGKNGGFVRQLDELFSPDGYFTEGAYYQRYAIWPFVIFSQAIDNNMPGLKIFAYRDHILQKALSTLLQMGYDGRFFNFNDAMPKGYDAQELVYAVDILYNADPAAGRQLLDVAARYQKGRFLPTDAGYAVARDIAAGKAEPFTLRSELYRDGADGTRGGVGVLHYDHSAIFFKATSHGLPHGHYDKLTWAFYDNGSPIITDYGAARFVNIEAKYKGHYTPQNKTFAMQTIAHNTVAVDGNSHFGGNYDLSMKHASEVYIFDAPGKTMVVSGKENNAVAGVAMHRTMVVVQGVAQYPVILDIFRLQSEREHTYDLPLYYNGHVMSLDFPYTRALDAMRPLGAANGYQHLWVEATGRTDKPTACFTWLTGDRFYSQTTLANPGMGMTLARIGANDPDFNLRNDPCYILSQKGRANHTFFSVVEPHGLYDLVVEQTSGATSSVTGLELLVDTPAYTVARASVGGKTITLYLSNADNSPSARHTAGGHGWTGAYEITIN